MFPALYIFILYAHGSLQQTNPSESNVCWEKNKGFVGKETSVESNVSSVNDCQRSCALDSNCLYYSYADRTALCVKYDNVTAVKESAGMISGIKYCGETVQKFKEDAKSDNITRSKTVGQLVTPSKLLVQKEIDNDPENVLSFNQAASSTQATIRGKMNQTPSDSKVNQQDSVFSSSESNPTGLGGNLLNGLVGVYKVLGGLTGLTNDASSGIKTTNVVENLGSSISQGLLSTESLVSAGSTILKTLPLEEFIKVGTDLAQAASPTLRENVHGGVPLTVKEKEDAIAPPTGAGEPEVTCLSEGMKCCVPRRSAPKYQSNPPKLNGVNKPRCRATYVSTTDFLCVTTRYDDAECEAKVMETSTLYIYRNIMEIPSKTMNDAICECLISKSSNTDSETLSIEMDAPTISGSAKWQYSLAAQDNQRESNYKLKTSLDRFENGTRLVSRIANTYIKSAQNTGFIPEGESTETLSGLMGSLADFSSGFKQLIAAAS